MTYTEPQKVFSIAGKDDATGDVIVKIVNANTTAVNARIQLQGNILVKSEGKAITLSADLATAENSFENPTRIIAQEKSIAAVSDNFNYILEPLSVTVLRILNKNKQ